MLLRLNPSGDEHPFDYQLGLKTSTGKRRTVDPVVIRGDPESFQLKYQQLQFENKDTRLVMSYHVQDDPTIPEVLIDLHLMDRVALPGFEEDEYLSVAVIHRQRSEGVLRTDVHHNWLNLHLPTGLSCNPYYHKSDLPRFDLAKQILNFVRGYQEPAAPEHSRYFGYTVKGSKANELGKVMKEIFETQKIANRNELIIELERRDYKVRRRKNGQPWGRKFMAVTTPDGTEVRLFGDPMTKSKPHLITRSSDNFYEQLEEMIERLNRMCAKRAKRNWQRYTSKLSPLSEEQAKQEGYGFIPIAITDLIPKNHHENKKRRTGLPSYRDLAASTVRKSKTAEPASQPRIENGRDGEAPSGPGKQMSGTPNPDESNRELANHGAGRGLADSVEQAALAVGGLVTRLIPRVRRNLTQSASKSKKLGS